MAPAAKSNDLKCFGPAPNAVLAFGRCISRDVRDDPQEAPSPVSHTEPIRRLILTMPAYNEARVIGELLGQAVAAFNKLDLEWNVVVVDDGSKDETARIVLDAARDEPRILLVQHEVNRGLGPAIMTGLARAVEIAEDPATLVVSMDADLTHPPPFVGQMIHAAEQGADVVIASRFQPGSQVVGLSPFRHLMSWGARNVFSLFLALPGVKDYTCGFRAVRAHRIREAIDRYGPDGFITRAGFACTDEILIKLALLGVRIREIPFILRYDLKQGSSKINLPVTIRETLRLVVWARRELRNAKLSR
jgi:dolichol-phosphate mannosyltransferase